MEPVSGDERSPIWWNVVFLARERETWWDAFTARWARHVLCYGYVPHSQRWVLVDPQKDRTVVSALDDDALDERLAAWMAQGCWIVRIKSGPGGPLSGRLLQSCAAIVARTVGAPSAWRPEGLFRKLLAAKGEVRYPHEHQDESAEGRPGDEGAARGG